MQTMHSFGTQLAEFLVLKMVIIVHCRNFGNETKTAYMAFSHSRGKKYTSAIVAKIIYKKCKKSSLTPVQSTSAVFYLIKQN